MHICWEASAQADCASRPPCQVVKAALCAGLYPGVARVQHPRTTYTKTEHGAVAKDSESYELKLFPKVG